MSTVWIGARHVMHPVFFQFSFQTPVSGILFFLHYGSEMLFNMRPLNAIGLQCLLLFPVRVLHAPFREKNSFAPHRICGHHRAFHGDIHRLLLAASGKL